VAGKARVTIAVPSLNQGRYLGTALESIFTQDVPVEVFVLDAGSSDDSRDVIRRFSDRLAGWRSHADAGQSAAINEGIANGSAPFVGWLNSDDWLEPRALRRLIDALDSHPEAAMAYGRMWNHVEPAGERRRNHEVHPFNERLMANFNIVAQPATLIRRTAWEAVGGVDESLQLAMDYDLWWKLFKRFGTPLFLDEHLAVNRRHDETKTSMQRRRHYREAMAVVRKHYGRVPLKWWLAQPVMVWYRSLVGR
jgi:glycosyltransferase involved in cell wall biosynthesis